jgi:uncharacterized membrane protein affecting hemolysin expression
MSEDFKALEEATGEYNDTFDIQKTNTVTDTTMSVLIYITTICLILSIGVILYRLYDQYDLGKSTQQIIAKEKEIEKAVIQRRSN